MHISGCRGLGAAVQLEIVQHHGEIPLSLFFPSWERSKGNRMPVRGRCQGITSSCSKQSTLYKSHFVLLSALSQNEKCLSASREGRQNIGLVGLASWGGYDLSFGFLSGGRLMTASWCLKTGCFFLKCGFNEGRAQLCLCHPSKKNRSHVHIMWWGKETGNREMQAKKPIWREAARRQGKGLWTEEQEMGGNKRGWLTFSEWDHQCRAV